MGIMAKRNMQVKNTMLFCVQIVIAFSSITRLGAAEKVSAQPTSQNLTF